MEWERVDVNERCFITITSTLDFRPWIPDEITLLCLPASSRTTTTAVNKMFGVLANIPLFVLFPWTVTLSRTFLAMLDWLSYRWLMAQIQKPCMEFKLVITLIHEDNRQWRHSLDLPKHARSNGKGIDVIAMTKQVDSDKTCSYLLEVTLMIMPKVTYPRPCPTCGKHFNSSHFFQHKKRSGTTEHRVLCLFCPLTFAYKQDMEWHVRQQHSNNPLCFPCTICGTELTSAKNLWLHVETVHSIQKHCFGCWYCNATFTRKADRQRHMRRVHGRICREQEVNLQYHLQHLSEEDDFKNEWVFVESRPIEQGEHNICPSGQTPIQSYFFFINALNP